MDVSLSGNRKESVTYASVCDTYHRFLWNHDGRVGRVAHTRGRRWRVVEADQASRVSGDRAVPNKVLEVQEVLAAANSTAAANTANQDAVRCSCMTDKLGFGG